VRPLVILLSMSPTPMTLHRSLSESKGLLLIMVQQLRSVTRSRLTRSALRILRKWAHNRLRKNHPNLHSFSAIHQLGLVPVGICDVSTEKPAGDGLAMHVNIGLPEILPCLPG